MCKCGLNLSKGKRGLGPNSWGNIRHYFPYHKEYHEPAKFHDVAYELEIIPIQQANDKFFQLMLKNKKTTWAYIYYLLVTLFGFIYY